MLGIDEYENIDAKIAAGAFPQDLLALLRESMGAHRRICWLFAGSRSPEELAGAPWTSYLVSTRLLEMPLFELAETRELLTEPMKHSRAFTEPEKVPRFTAEFWGDHGIERLHLKLAAGRTWCSWWRNAPWRWSTRKGAPGSTRSLKGPATAR